MLQCLNASMQSIARQQQLQHFPNLIVCIFDFLFVFLAFRHCRVGNVNNNQLCTKMAMERAVLRLTHENEKGT